MSELGRLFTQDLKAALAHPWKVARDKYECPDCGSNAIARERLHTKRYDSNGVTSTDVDHFIRCMACGCDADE